MLAHLKSVFRITNFEPVLIGLSTILRYHEPFTKTH